MTTLLPIRCQKYVLKVPQKSDWRPPTRHRIAISPTMLLKRTQEKLLKIRCILTCRAWALQKYLFRRLTRRLPHILVHLRHCSHQRRILRPVLIPSMHLRCCDFCTFTRHLTLLTVHPKWHLFLSLCIVHWCRKLSLTIWHTQKRMLSGSSRPWYPNLQNWRMLRRALPGNRSWARD